MNASLVAWKHKADIDEIVKTNYQEQRCNSIEEKTNIFPEEVPVVLSILALTLSALAISLARHIVGTFLDRCPLAILLVLENERVAL